VLSDRKIIEMVESGRVAISPFSEKQVQPASYDVTLKEQILIHQAEAYQVIDPRKSLSDNFVKTKEYIGAYIIYPRDFILASTNEWISLPDDITARIEGKSSLGRLGLIVHSTAGYIDPGFDGRITLEISNIGKNAIMLLPGMPIAQISFSTMYGKSERPYGSDGLNSKYQHQSEATASLYSKNFDKEMC
jgi:dCTP deaminase